MTYIKLSITVFFILLVSLANAQVTIGSDKAPESFSILQLEGTSGGLRLNKLTTAQRNALPIGNNGESTGLAIYNIDSKSIEVYDGTNWITLNPFTLSATNGAVVENNAVSLGGALTKNTTITTAANQTLTIAGSTANAFSVAGSTLSVNASNNRIGIGTATPAAKLDVSGDIRIGTTTAMNNLNNASLLVRDNSSGVIGTVTPMSIKTPSITANGGNATVDVTSILRNGPGFLIINTANGCAREMNTVFSSNYSPGTGNSPIGMPLFFVSAIGRDVTGKAEMTNAMKYSVTFDSVAGCADGGNGSQFNFDIDTSVPGKITITNNGNIARSYIIRMSPLF